MKQKYSLSFAHCLLTIFVLSISANNIVYGQTFIHPGLDQNAKDLAQMKKLVITGQQPYKDAFARLKAAVDTNFVPQSHTHVLRGPYGRPNIGGNDLSKSAAMAYNNAIAWYITNDKKYAEKAGNLQIAGL